MSAALVLIVRDDGGAVNACLCAVSVSSSSSGTSTCSQYVQFQPRRLSAAFIAARIWPPKNERPRAPATIASYAMNLACSNVGTTTGCGGIEPLQAICSVVQIALLPLAR